MSAKQQYASENLCHPCAHTTHRLMHAPPSSLNLSSRARWQQKGLKKGFRGALFCGGLLSTFLTDELSCTCVNVPTTHPPCPRSISTRNAALTHSSANSKGRSFSPPLAPCVERVLPRHASVRGNCNYSLVSASFPSGSCAQPNFFIMGANQQAPAG